MLKRLQSRHEDAELPASIVEWLRQCSGYSQQFWDRARQSPEVTLTQCDFESVAQALFVLRSRSRVGVFVEWGCGLAAITGVASLLGMQAIGFEIEPELCQAAREQLAQAGLAAEVHQENFLPSGAQALATPEDPVVSLRHVGAKHSEQTRADYALSIAGIVYVYSWPGEEHFLKLVFDRYARFGTLLLLYRGPEQVEVYRKY